MNIIAYLEIAQALYKTQSSAVQNKIQFPNPAFPKQRKPPAPDQSRSGQKYVPGAASANTKSDTFRFHRYKIQIESALLFLSITYRERRKTVAAALFPGKRGICDPLSAGVTDGLSQFPQNTLLASAFLPCLST